MLVIVLGLMVLLSAAGVEAAAQELPREATLPLAWANKAATAAQEKCKQDGYRVSVAVVDRAGVLKVLMRGDGAGPHSTDSSTKKAYTAACRLKSGARWSAASASVARPEAIWTRSAPRPAWIVSARRRRSRRPSEMSCFSRSLLRLMAVLVAAWLTLPLFSSFAGDATGALSPQATPSHEHPESKSIEKILYSEYNHHMSGVGVLLIGLLAMGMELGFAHRPNLKAVQWLWPAGWMILGTFLFIRSDPDNWPWGRIGFIETFTDPETLQHKFFSVVVFAIGMIEGVQIGGRSNGHGSGSGWRLVFPVLGIGAGLLLGVHSFVHAHVPRVFWQHLAFAAVGILIGTTKLLRDRAILGTGYRPLVWPALLIVFAVQLILYTER
jgi:uncharacterized protein GlcG (DUF336 family)